MKGIMHQINIKPQTLGERGLPKLSIDSVEVKLTGLDGDYNMYRAEKKEGNLNRAVMLMPFETLDDLRREGWAVEPGHLGENITTKGISYESFTIGSVYKIGNNNVFLRITEACTPCKNLRILPYVGEERIDDFIRTLLNRRGWYAKVLYSGRISREDIIERID